MLHERIKKDVLHKTSLSGILSFKQKCIPKFRIQENTLKSLDPFNDYPQVCSIQIVAKNIKIHKWKKMESLEIQSFDIRPLNCYRKRFSLCLTDLLKKPEIGLRRINLTFRKKELDIERELADFANGIGRHSKDLERLSVNFGVCFSKNCQGFLELARQVGLNCRNLKEFHFYFGPIQNGMRSETLRSFVRFRSRIERYFSGIERLSFDMRYSFDYSNNETIFSSIDPMILKTRNRERLFKLTRVSMNLEDNYWISYQTFQKVFASLCEFKGNLQKLDLNFSSCSIKENKTQTIENSKGMIQKTNLKSLVLLLNFNYEFNDKGVEDLISDFKMNLDNKLESLKLGFVCCKKISIYGFGVLCQNISEYFFQLKSLDLNFHGCLIDKDEFRVIIEGLKGCIRHLEKFVLSLFGCKSITNEGLEMLSEALVMSGENLKELSLTFGLGGDILLRDFGMKLGRGLVGLKCLKLRIFNREEHDLKFNLLQIFEPIPKVIFKSS